MNYRRLLMLVAAVGVVVAACSSTDTDAATTTTEATVTDSSTTSTPQQSNSNGDLVAQDGDTVEVHYVGTLDDGSQFDSSRDRGAPFNFTVGTGQVISGFDEAVRGALEGDTNTVRMEAADAYGEWSEENILDLPYDPTQGEIAIGDQVTLGSGQPATVLEVFDATVKLDANHPLAGEALTFEIEVLVITRN